MRSTPNEFSALGLGKWDYVGNKDAIKKYLKEGVERSKNFESLYTMGMRGFGDCELSSSRSLTFKPR